MPLLNRALDDTWEIVRWVPAMLQDDYSVARWNWPEPICNADDDDWASEICYRVAYQSIVTILESLDLWN